MSCKEKTKEKKFFDVPSYFKQEIEYIKTNLSSVSKTSVYNGVISTQYLSVKDINWEKEFGIFLECNINKPVYYANMEVLESPAWQGPSEEEKGSVMYISKNKILSIQRVSVDSRKGIVSGINIHLEKSNLISNTFIDAWYVKDSSYTISGEQAIKNLGDKNTFFVNGKFK